MFNAGCIFSVANRICLITGSLPAARIVSARGEFLTWQVDKTAAKNEAVNEGRGESKRHKCLFTLRRVAYLPETLQMRLKGNSCTLE